MSDSVTLVPAWRRNDPKIAGDAKNFWLKLRVLSPAAVEQRVRELCAAAYVGDELVGVSTMELGQSPLLRCRVGFFRCLADPVYHHRRLASRLTKYSRALLEQWSKENPSEKVLAMVAILESPNFDRLAKRPMWHADVDYWLIGYTPNGHQIRLTWFEHARLE